MKAYVKTLLLTGLMAGLCACAGNNEDMKTQMQNGARTDIDENGMINAGDRALDLEPGNDVRRPTSYGANDLHALRIADLANDIPGVSRSSSIVYGKDIVVGIQVRDDSDAATLEQKVKRSIQEREPDYNIYVTSNIQMNQRIRALTENSANPYSQSVQPSQTQRDMQTEMSRLLNDLHRMNAHAPR